MKKKYSKWHSVLLKRLLCCGTAVCLALCLGLLPIAAAPGPGQNACGPSAGGPSAGSQTGEVLVGGMPFGVKFYTEGVLVVGFCDLEGHVNPAREAGMQVRDIITHLDGKPLSSAAELTAAVENSGGRALTLTVHRMSGQTAGSGGSGKKTSKGNGTGTHTPGSGASGAAGSLTLSVTPQFSKEENRYKTGLWVRDSGAGIGTVTFIIPSTRAFAGLGHGICDGDTGELVPIGRGQVTDVTVSGIEKGVAGDPGAIKGYFNPGKTGTLVGNTPCGVFGIFTSLPQEAQTRMPVAARSEIREGPATIRCTLDDGQVGEYAVTISAPDRTATGSKCFTVTVTDPTLLEKTGGIVQGMSGSPIIQNGKLIGAVTHVLINDPTTGYGIFVDNMLRDMPELLR